MVESEHTSKRKLLVEVTIVDNRYPEDVTETDDSDEVIVSFIDEHLGEVTRKEHSYPWSIESVKLVKPKLKPTEWEVEYGLLVHDADGWRYPNPIAWEEPITREDFESRMSRSTIEVVDRNKFQMYTSRY